ncbi:hypothetical protein Syn33_030 [Prochlorococcus phage Syn33]|uniref:Uncharacterized protein n=3 Tax=Brizovirus syn33 TaxID=2734097 RepID=E3SQR7_9CAUD|nr:hypothetical protein Syn33_030 [Prochlorococcus phage Syn33]ADO99753.1 hypothetical protein Syn33_030 [Prochlorococcus phage Syn33]
MEVSPKKRQRKTGKTSGKVQKQIKVVNSRKKELFPWVETFPYFMQDMSEGKKCWFTCEEHAEKYVNRYNCNYNLYFYTGK